MEVREVHPGLITRVSTEQHIILDNIAFNTILAVILWDFKMLKENTAAIVKVWGHNLKILNWNGISTLHPPVLLFDPPLICFCFPVSLFQTSYCFGILSNSATFLWLLSVFSFPPWFPFLDHIISAKTIFL